MKLWALSESAGRHLAHAPVEGKARLSYEDRNVDLAPGDIAYGPTRDATAIPLGIFASCSST